MPSGNPVIFGAADKRATHGGIPLFISDSHMKSKLMKCEIKKLDI